MALAAASLARVWLATGGRGSLEKGSCQPQLQRSGFKEKCHFEHFAEDFRILETLRQLARLSRVLPCYGDLARVCLATSSRGNLQKKEGRFARLSLATALAAASF